MNATWRDFADSMLPAGIRTMKLGCALGLILCIITQRVCAQSIGGRDSTHPPTPEIPIVSLDASTTPDEARLNHQAQASQRDIRLASRQVSCPDPSTNELCASDYCFLAQNNGDSRWGTCCPAGFYLWLDSGEWSKQRCCPAGSTLSQCGSDGVSEPPLQPVSCGSDGTRSGWGCVYPNLNVNEAAASKAIFSSISATVCVGLWLSSWVYQCDLVAG